MARKTPSILSRVGRALRTPFDAVASATKSLAKALGLGPRKAARVVKTTPVWRKATPAEHRILGKSPSSKTYVPASVTRVMASTPTLPQRQVRNLKGGMTVEKQIEARASGALPYGGKSPEATRHRAEIQKSENAGRRARRRAIDAGDFTVADRRGRRYSPEAMKGGRYEKLMTKKLKDPDNLDLLDDGDFWELVHTAEELNDPRLSIIFPSSNRGVREAA